MACDAGWRPDPVIAGGRLDVPGVSRSSSSSRISSARSPEKGRLRSVAPPVAGRSRWRNGWPTR